MSLVRRKYNPSAAPIKGAGSLSARAEKISIQAHLAYCELKLRLATRRHQPARRRVLDILHQYWRAGRFPKNTYHPGRRPVFIDASNVYCAVGYLMSKTGADELARKINRQDKFIRLEESDRQDVARWLEDNGLKPAEAVLIQPGYGPWAPVYYHSGFGWAESLILVGSIAMTLALFAPTLIMLKAARKSWRQRLVGVLKVCAFMAIALLAWPAHDSLFQSAGALSKAPPEWVRILFFVGIINILVLLPAVLWWRRTGNRQYKIGKLCLKVFIYAVALFALPLLFVSGYDLAGDTMSLVSYGVNLSVLALAVATFLVVDKPFKRGRRLVYTGLGVMAAAGLALTFIVPSPAHAFDKVFNQTAVECTAAGYDAAYTDRPLDEIMSCVELEERHWPRAFNFCWEPITEFNRRAIWQWEFVGRIAAPPVGDPCDWTYYSYPIEDPPDGWREFPLPHFR